MYTEVILRLQDCFGNEDISEVKGTNVGFCLLCCAAVVLSLRIEITVFPRMKGVGALQHLFKGLFISTLSVATYLHHNIVRNLPSFYVQLYQVFDVSCSPYLVGTMRHM